MYEPATDMNPRVNDYFIKLEKWQGELEKLRFILLDCGLTEELKWSVPIYTYCGTNLIGINGLKECCALSFFNGALFMMWKVSW